MLSLGSGIAEAPLTGGCLTLLCSSIGTPYEIETEGRILIVEDLNTDPYLVDTALNHLKLAGKLDGIAGFAFGTSVNLSYQTLPEGPESTLSVEEILDELIAPLGIPAISNVPFGHGKHMATMPLGARARLDADGQATSRCSSPASRQPKGPNSPPKPKEQAHEAPSTHRPRSRLRARAGGADRRAGDRRAAQNGGGDGGGGTVAAAETARPRPAAPPTSNPAAARRPAPPARRAVVDDGSTHGAADRLGPGPADAEPVRRLDEENYNVWSLTWDLLIELLPRGPEPRPRHRRELGGLRRQEDRHLQARRPQVVRRRADHLRRRQVLARGARRGGLPVQRLHDVDHEDRDARSEDRRDPHEASRTRA